MAVLVCEYCAVGLVNADESAWEGKSDEDKAAIDASIESLGWGVIEERADGGGYFSCYVCNDVSIDGSVFIPN